MQFYRYFLIISKMYTFSSLGLNSFSPAGMDKTAQYWIWPDLTPSYARESLLIGSYSAIADQRFEHFI